MKQPTTQGLFQYWNTVRAGRIAPRRYEIEPSEIAPFLSESVILEEPDSDACRMRVVGSRVSDMLGPDLRGELFFELWDEADQLVLHDNMQTIVNHGGVGLFELHGGCDGQLQHAAFEMLLLPLTHLGDRVERILGSISAIRAPSWLEMSHPAHISLTKNKIIWPDGRPHALVEAMLEDRGAEPVPSLRPHSLVRRARLVRNDRRSFLVYQGGRAEED